MPTVSHVNWNYYVDCTNSYNETDDIFSKNNSISGTDDKQFENEDKRASETNNEMFDEGIVKHETEQNERDKSHNDRIDDEGIVLKSDKESKYKESENVKIKLKQIIKRKKSIIDHINDITKQSKAKTDIYKRKNKQVHSTEIPLKTKVEIYRLKNDSKNIISKVCNKETKRKHSINVFKEGNNEAKSMKKTIKDVERTDKVKIEEANKHINYFKKRKEDTKWRINSGMLATLVFLNVAGHSVAVEVLSSNSLASLLGYPETCSLGGELRECTLSLACWLRGGTGHGGCGGWLFSCCRLPNHSWEKEDNSIQSDWAYKMSPPRLKNVPQRNVMPNNVFRRRVDDDVEKVDCGVPSSSFLQKRIIGGREARLAEFPWQAHVRISEFQCGGVLVSQWYVATAAHCVSRAHVRDIVVWLGALDTSAGSQTARKVGVHKKILHPLFQFRMTQPDRFDIALLKLTRPVLFSRHIRAICLPDAALALRGRSAVIAGWGKTDATDTHTGTNMLRSATVPILSKEQCIAWHQSKQISVEIHSEMICAGHSDGHQDACLGDSGGPLILLDNGRYYLVGITSAGFGCGVDHQPGIYHNVLTTTAWIRGVLRTDSYHDHDMYI